MELSTELELNESIFFASTKEAAGSLPRGAQNSGAQRFASIFRRRPVQIKEGSAPLGYSIVRGGGSLAYTVQRREYPQWIESSRLPTCLGPEIYEKPWSAIYGEN